jgi:hypothetical protein
LDIKDIQIKMTDDRFVTMSPQAFKSAAKT